MNQYPYAEQQPPNEAVVHSKLLAPPQDPLGVGEFCAATAAMKVAARIIENCIVSVKSEPVEFKAVKGEEGNPSRAAGRGFI